MLHGGTQIRIRIDYPDGNSFELSEGSLLYRLNLQILFSRPHCASLEVRNY
jgi:hypothetical protein